MFVVNAVGEEHRQLAILGRHRADLVERLVVAAAGKDEPARAQRRLTFFANADFGHTAMPRSRIVSRAFWLSLRWLHTGSQTTSISTWSTSGARSRRAR